MADLQVIADAVIKGDRNTVAEQCQAALDEGVPVEEVLAKGLIAGMNVVGKAFKANEIYVPEVLIAARAMKSAMEYLEPKLAEAGIEPLGTVLIGTVAGDLHDIGKNLVVMMWKGAGFNVVDLGTDVPPEKFVSAVKESGAKLVGMSALLTTTMPMIEKTAKALRDAGIEAKIVIGGAPVTQEYADKIGVDGYAADAASAVDIVKDLLGIAA